MKNKICFYLSSCCFFFHCDHQQLQYFKFNNNTQHTLCVAVDKLKLHGAIAAAAVAVALYSLEKNRQLEKNKNKNENKKRDENSN